MKTKRLVPVIPPRFAVGLLAATLAFAGCADRLHSAAKVSESFERTVALSANGALEVSNVNGSIDLTAWDRNEVRIEAVKKARSVEKLEQVEIEIVATADRVAIETELPRNGDASVEYRITAPAGARAEVDTVNGRVKIDGMRGDVSARSVNGAIAAEGLVGSTSMTTVNGAVVARYGAAPAGGKHHFKAVNGAIAVYLPSNPDASFEAKTVNGSINADFGLEVTRARFGPMKSLDGKLGAGAGKFSFSTVNGSIKILHSGASAGVR